MNRQMLGYIIFFSEILLPYVLIAVLGGGAFKHWCPTWAIWTYAGVVFIISSFILAPMIFDDESPFKIKNNDK